LLPAFSSVSWLVGVKTSIVRMPPSTWPPTAPARDGVTMDHPHRGAAVLGLTCQQFVDGAAARGQSRETARAAYRRVMREGVPGPAGAGLAGIAEELADERAVKLALRLADGRPCEAVLIEGSGAGGVGRRTLCVSSQVGCARGCGFCETARMGLVRNLSAAEIVAQWHLARFAVGAEVRNVVFMGMGEPMDNLDAVLQAVRVLADRDGAAVATSRITISTVGRTDGIRRLAAFADQPGWRRLRLAVSVNAPNDEVRRRLMPIARAEPMGALRAAMLAWTAGTLRRVLIEYVLIPGVNDDDGHADELVAYLADLPCTVNVIPYNPRRGSPWPAPQEADVARFTSRIAAGGLPVRRRWTRGRAVWAACGQLGDGPRASFG
jgi:23S rRNA (adenine2503-C2)-methyltransferase